MTQPVPPRKEPTVWNYPMAITISVLVLGVVAVCAIAAWVIVSR